MIGRLKPGVTIQKAAAEMDALYRAVDQANPKQGMPNRLAVVAPLANARISKSSRSLLLGVDITAHPSISEDSASSTCYVDSTVHNSQLPDFASTPYTVHGLSH
jgi:hypothetical protein